MYKNRFMVLTILILLVPVGYAVFALNSGDTGIDIDKGLLDLSTGDLASEGIAPLNGEWEFYWMNLITEGTDDLQPTMLVSVPSSWEQYDRDDREEKLPAAGYASYRILISNAPEEPLAIYQTNTATAYKLFVNGELKGSNGEFEGAPGRVLPSARPQLIEIGAHKNYEIVLQVANDIYARGGLWFTPYIGKVADVEHFSRITGYKDLFLLGGLFMIGLYFLVIYQFNRNQKEYLIFVLLCFIISMRIMVYGSYFILTLFPDISYRNIAIIIYATVFWGPAIYLKLVAEIFYPGESLPGVKAALLYSGLAFLFVLLAPVKVFTGLATAFNSVAIIIQVYTLFLVIKAKKDNLPNADYILAGTVLIFIGLIYDVLFHKNYIFNQLGLIAPLTYFIFALLISVLLAKRYSDTFQEIDNLNKELKQMDILKTRVFETELALLQAQIKPHFLFNALNVIATLCRMEPEKARKLILDLSRFLQQSFNFNQLPTYISFAEELEYVQSYVNIEKARFKDKLTVNYELEDVEKLQVPPLIIQPLVENAIRHGIRKKRGSGTVTVRTKSEPSFYLIEVEDDGAGMSVEQIEQIQRQDHQFTGAKGVGLANIKRRLKELYGSTLDIESSPGRGTLVTFIIPKIFGGRNESSTD